MKQKFLLLLTALLLSAFSFGAAAEVTIYLDKSSLPSNWNGEAKIWAWDNSSNYTGGSWPGQAMSQSDEYPEYLVWSNSSVNGNISIIFSNNGQTNDFNGVTPGLHVYKINLNQTNDKYNIDEVDINVDGSPEISSSDNNNYIVIHPVEGLAGNIYYTVDGSDPDATSNLYEGPFVMEEDATIKAIQLDGLLRSKIATYEFVWNYIPDTGGRGYAFFASTSGKAVQICATDLPYFPVAGQPEPANMPEELYLLGNLANKTDWSTAHASGDETDFVGFRYGDCIVFNDIHLELDYDDGSTDANAYFTLVTFLSAAGSNPGNWSEVNQHDRIGALTENEVIEINKPTPFERRSGNADYVGGTKSWKAPKGEYRLVVNFSNNTIILTDKSKLEFTDMDLMSVETDSISYEPGVLYRTELTDYFSQKLIGGDLNVAFLDSDGQLFKVPTHISEGTSYVYNEASGDWSEAQRVAVGIHNADLFVNSADTKLESTYGAKNAKYYIGDVVTNIPDNGMVDIDFSAHNPNALVNVRWTAENEQGITYHGAYRLVNHDPATPVRVYGTVPETWGRIKYRMVSDLNPDPTNADYDADYVREGYLDQEEGTYFYTEIEPHMMHATITFSNGGAAPASSRRRVVAADQSVEQHLDGVTSYFDNNGEHWDTSTYNNVTTGVEAVGVDQLPATYFNLQGIRVAEPAKGAIYIERRGNDINKVVR